MGEGNAGQSCSGNHEACAKDNGMGVSMRAGVSVI